METPEQEFDFEKEAPILSKMKGKNPGFEVPDGYFESFNSRVMAQIATAPAGSGITDNRSPAPSFSLVSAAAVMAILVLFSGFVLWNSQREPIADFDQLTQEEIYASLDVTDLDEYALAEFMGDEALAAFEEKQDLSSESIDAYFDEENLWNEVELTEENLQEVDFEWLDENF